MAGAPEAYLGSLPLGVTSQGQNSIVLVEVEESRKSNHRWAEDGDVSPVAPEGPC